VPEAPVMPVPVVVGRITIDIFWLIRNIGIGTISAVLAPAVFKFSIAVIEKPEPGANNHSKINACNAAHKLFAHHVRSFLEASNLGGIHPSSVETVASLLSAAVLSEISISSIEILNCTFWFATRYLRRGKPISADLTAQPRFSAAR
jgi:hypothetical protein